MYIDLEMRLIDGVLGGGGGSGGSVSKKTFFGPLGLILVKIRGGAGPPTRPLDPPLVY